MAKAGFARKTFVYKRVGDIEIRADVWRVWDGKPRPVVLHLHGGGLINGSRRDVGPFLKPFCEAEGVVLVSCDYRLAPEVKLPEIVADLHDALAWVRRDGPKLFGADTSRLVVMGGSAGGYLTLMAGAFGEPRPTALVSLFGYGDVDGDWLSKPSKYYRDETPPIPAETARAAVGRGVLTGTVWGEGRTKARQWYYRYLRQNGLWTREVTGLDPATQRRELGAYCPVRNVTAAFPPTLLIHGTADTDVPYRKSVDMAAQLKRHGVDHELITARGAGHGLSKITPADAEQIEASMKTFLLKHLKPGNIESTNVGISNR